MLGRRLQTADGDENMLSHKRDHDSALATEPEINALRDSVRVLGEVIRHLSERIEVLEAGAALMRRLPAAKI